MTRKPETIAFWRGRLPHWEVVDGRYFVTLCLAGAIPEQGHDRIHAIAAELDKMSENDKEGRLAIQRRIFAEMATWLNRAERVTHLRNPEVARMLMEAIAFREGKQWHMFEFVIMPNHIHLFFEIAAGCQPGAKEESRLKHLLEQFKRWTGHQAVRLLELDGGQFWQDEWFDHWSRSDEEDEKIAVYIRRNPETAKLVADYRQWPFGSWSKGVDGGLLTAAQ